jgi:hypothetical protein
MFLELRGNLAKRRIRPKVGDDPLQGHRIAATMNFGGLTEGPHAPCTFTACENLFYDFNPSQSAVPVDFF